MKMSDFKKIIKELGIKSDYTNLLEKSENLYKNLENVLDTLESQKYNRVLFFQKNILNIVPKFQEEVQV